MYQIRPDIVAIIEDADTGKYAGLQNQQQQVAHIARRRSSEDTGTLAVQQEVFYQLQQKAAAARKDIGRQEKTA
jgi:hypothetical protein